jgi:hypothetical protein
LSTLSGAAGAEDKKEGGATPKRLSASMKIYLGLVAIMVVLAILKAFLPLELNQGQQTPWWQMVLVAVLGLIGVILSPKAGFPEMWDPEISNKQRFWIPALVGIGVGIVMVVFDLVQPLGSQAQTRFPDSVIVFLLAGLVEEIIIHLFLTTLLIWLISGVILRGRYQALVFWVVAAGGGLLYWFLQINAIMTYFPEQFSALLAVQTFLVIMLTITAGAYLFRKGGFLAALSLRYGFYLAWHIIWGGGIGLVRYFL